MIDYSDLVVEEYVTYCVTPPEIVHRQEKGSGKTIPLVRVVCKYNDIDEQTWERKADMRESNPELFSCMC